jgi:cytochrome b561
LAKTRGTFYIPGANKESGATMNTPVRDLPTRYGIVAMTLHWLIAAAIITNIIVILSVPEDRSPQAFALMSFHMALGLTVLVLSILRLIWRVINPSPPPPAGLNRWIHVSGKAMQHVLYTLMVAIPLAGWLMVSASHFSPSWFGLFTWPAFPGFAGLDKAASHDWHETFETIHVVLGWAMVVLIPCHIGAGLYHHVLRKDNVLLRMLPGTRLRNGV